MFSNESQIIQDYAWLENHLGPLVPMEVVLRVDKSKCDLDLFGQMQLVSKIQERVVKLDEVGSALAATTFARPMPEQPSMMERRVWCSKLERHREDLHDYLTGDDHEELWRISARVNALTDLDYGDFVQTIREAVDPIVAQEKADGVEGVSVTYTGIIPLVYKAQRSMLNGLLLNFAGDVILIAVAMVFLVRDWSAGLLLILPSVFPLAVIFGAMGYLGVVVDVGTVMTPAVALGVTVDDAIHFMLWVRHGQERGMTRPQAIMFAYEDCARAIYQSWAVIGLGLFAFSLSSFMPTQRFGCLMLLMLTVSSVGNLVLMPALLAGPTGNFFWKKGEKLLQKHAEAEGHATPELSEAIVHVEPSPVPPAPHMLPGKGSRKRSRRQSAGH
jgi:predicted RND superfamily exporter protein